MFPYDENPISKINASEDIEKYGIQSLMRALNIGRVVAFVGSGASLKFDQPSWGDTKTRAIKLFFLSDKSIQNSTIWQDKDGNPSTFQLEYQASLTPLANEIREIFDRKVLDANYLIGLIEKYFAEVEVILKKHVSGSSDLVDLLKQGWKDAQHSRSGGARGISPNSSHRYRPEEWAMAQDGPQITPGEFETPAKTLDEFRKIFAECFRSREPDEADPKALILKQAPALSDLISSFVRTLLSGSGGRVVLAWDEANMANRIAQDIQAIDGSRALRTQLGITRFLTLNYDLELERMLLEEGRSAPIGDHQFFLEFINQDDNFDNSEASKYESGKGRAVTLSSASGRVLRSTSSRAETLADLFAFGAFPTNYDASVHHLHGRVDDSKNMIVTPSDYQHIYYGRSDQKKSFDEARHAVFTGSDLLVIGMGDKEADVLKPLRDFLELETDRKDAYGKVYYLTKSNLGGEADFREAFWKSRIENLALTQRLHQDYGMHVLFIDHTFALASQNGWTKEIANMFYARAELRYYVKTLEKNEAPTAWNSPEHDARFNAVFAEKAASIRSDFRDPRPEQTVARDILAALHTHHAFLLNDAAQDRREAALNVIRALEAQLLNTGLVHYAEELGTGRYEWWKKWSERPRLRCAVYGRHHYERTKRGHFVLKDTAGADDQAPLIWRQTNLETDFGLAPFRLGDPLEGERHEAPQFTSFVIETAKARAEAIKAARSYNDAAGTRSKKPPSSRSKADRRKETYPTQFPASIARISMPPGSGKGRLTSFFTTKQRIFHSDIPSVADDKKPSSRKLPLSLLFHAPFADGFVPSDTEDVNDSNSPYIGCLTAHLTFSLEFSSVIMALGRMLQNVLPQLRAHMDFSDQKAEQEGKYDYFKSYQFNERNDREPMLKTLTEMFEFFARVCPPQGWPKRVMFMVSYLDRLVDDAGDAYSPIHRSFFRLISGWLDPKSHLRLPIDFVFINCHANRPIRYLSKERQFDENENRIDDKWAVSGWAIRHDRQCALEHWKELRRVDAKEVFKEGLRNAVRIKNRLKPDDPQIVTIAEEVFSWVQEDESTHTETMFVKLPAGVNGFMNRRVLNGYLIAGLAYETWEKTRHHRTVASAHKTAFHALWKLHYRALSAAYTRNKTLGLSFELLAIYRRMDRETDQDTNGVIGKTVDYARNLESKHSQIKERLRALIVDHLALFSHPVSTDTLKRCPEINAVLHELEQFRDKRGTDPIDDVLKDLAARGLSCRYVKFSEVTRDHKTEPGDIDQTHDLAYTKFVYALDTRLISAIRARSNLSVYGHYNLIAFQPSLYPSQPEHSIKPEIAHFNRVAEVVRALVKPCHQELVELKKKIENLPELDPDDAPTEDNWGCFASLLNENEFRQKFEPFSEQLRAAYALVRGTFSISVISRLNEDFQSVGGEAPFDEYRTWTRKLLNTARLLSWFVEWFHEAQTLDEGQKSFALPMNEPFFRDEVSWLYNERALVSFIQGRLFDAVPLFEQAQRVLGTSHENTNSVSYKATHRRVQLNMALAQLERGHISTAQDAFESIIRERKNDGIAKRHRRSIAMRAGIWRCVII